MESADCIPRVGLAMLRVPMVDVFTQLNSAMVVMIVEMAVMSLDVVCIECDFLQACVYKCMI